MKRSIPDCYHGNEYEFKNTHRVITLYNDTNKIVLSENDVKELLKLFKEKKEGYDELEI